MDSVGLIVSALATGNTLRSPDAPGPVATGPALGGVMAGTAAVQGAYSRLWSRVRRSLAGRPAGAMMLARHAEAPHTWAAPLTAELRAAGAGENPELVAAATDLLRMMNQNGCADPDAALTPILR
jgi:hypothetical protein